MMHAKVSVIAEAGVNHNGSVDLAKQLIDVAADAGVDAVKFQTFKADRLVSRNASKANYQTRETGVQQRQLEMIQTLELGRNAHFALVEHCAYRGVEFMSTPFDESSLEFLVSELGVSSLKISSGDITNAPLLLKAAATGKPLILSTGMSTLGDVELALGILAFGYLERRDEPSPDGFLQAYFSVEGRAKLAEKVTLLHCTTEYPAPFGAVDLRAMKTMSIAFDLPIGLSDHTLGIAASVAAVALGASVIEKHFTLDRGLPGPDHKASLTPDELHALVRSVREVEAALGSAVKVPASCELDNMTVARRSLVAARDIQPGEAFSPDNIAVKRPGNGVSPLRYWECMGRTSHKAYREDDLIDL